MTRKEEVKETGRRLGSFLRHLKRQMLNEDWMEQILEIAMRKEKMSKKLKNYHETVRSEKMGTSFGHYPRRLKAKYWLKNGWSKFGKLL